MYTIEVMALIERKNTDGDDRKTTRVVDQKDSGHGGVEGVKDDSLKTVKIVAVIGRGKKKGAT